MYKNFQCEPHDSELLLAGQRVPPGLYREVERRRQVYLEVEDVLPATLDGRVACYVRIERLWGARITTEAR